MTRVLRSWLTVTEVPNELYIIKDAPRYGVMFDADDIRIKVIDFLKNQLK
jgi:hypothetical protein